MVFVTAHHQMCCSSLQVGAAALTGIESWLFVIDVLRRFTARTEITSTVGLKIRVFLQKGSFSLLTTPVYPTLIEIIIVMIASICFSRLTWTRKTRAVVTVTDGVEEPIRLVAYSCI